MTELADRHRVFLIHTALAREWHTLNLLRVHCRAQISKRSWLPRLTYLRNLFLLMLLLWRLVANLKNIGELGCSLWLGALHAITGLDQELSLVNFVTRL